MYHIRYEALKVKSEKWKNFWKNWRFENDDIFFCDFNCISIQLYMFHPSAQWHPWMGLVFLSTSRKGYFCKFCNTLAIWQSMNIKWYQQVLYERFVFQFFIFFFYCKHLICTIVSCFEVVFLLQAISLWGFNDISSIENWKKSRRERGK